MSTPEEVWTTRLHAAVDDHPSALTFDVRSYVTAGHRRARRNRGAALAATIALIAAGAVVSAVTASRGGEPQPAPPVAPHVPASAKTPNGWVAVDLRRDNGQGAAGAFHTNIYLVRPGDEPLPLDVAGSDAASDACPAWSPDGTRLMFGRVPGSSDDTSSGAELVIVSVDRNGATGNPKVIDLPGYEGWTGYEPHPCGAWAPDGRWVAFPGNDQVWLVDTQTSQIRRLPDLRPTDVEWRPGTDELTIAGDNSDPTRGLSSATPITVYTVSTAELRQLGSVEAEYITWSPDGTTLAYSGDQEHDKHALALVDADGTNRRLLVADMGEAGHGIGPVWSPSGDRIVYQKLISAPEKDEIVLVKVVDGTEEVIAQEDRELGYPYYVTWSPDGETLLCWVYVYNIEGGHPAGDGVITIAVDAPYNARLLMDAAREPAWGRQPQ